MPMTRFQAGGVRNSTGMAAAASGATATSLYNQAITQFQAELALSPVSAATTALTGDLANNAHVHWELAEIYHTLGDTTHEGTELGLYLKATLWHSDTYPLRITLAHARLAALGISVDLPQVETVVKKNTDSSVKSKIPRAKKP